MLESHFRSLSQSAWFVIATVLVSLPLQQWTVSEMPAAFISSGRSASLSSLFFLSSRMHSVKTKLLFAFDKWGRKANKKQNKKHCGIMPSFQCASSSAQITTAVSFALYRSAILSAQITTAYVLQVRRTTDLPIYLWRPEMNLSLFEWSGFSVWDRVILLNCTEIPST